MSIYKRGAVYWYDFEFKGERHNRSTRTRNKEVAKQIESAERTRLAKGEAGIRERVTAPTLKEFAPRFESAIVTLCAESLPQSSSTREAPASARRRFGSRYSAERD